MTDINKIIEEEAERYSQYNGVMPKASFEMHKQFAVKTFIKGANFILHHYRWRKVEEEMPEQDASLLIESGRKTYKGRMEKIGTIKTKPVLVKYADGSHVIATRCQCKGDSYYWWDCHESFDKDYFMYITHWRPIE